MKNTVAGTMNLAFAFSSALNSAVAASFCQSATSRSSSAVCSCGGLPFERPSGATSVADPACGVRSAFGGGCLRVIGNGQTGCGPMDECGAMSTVGRLSRSGRSFKRDRGASGGSLSETVRQPLSTLSRLASRIEARLLDSSRGHSRETEALPAASPIGGRWSAAGCVQCCSTPFGRCLRRRQDPQVARNRRKLAIRQSSQQLGDQSG